MSHGPASARGRGADPLRLPSPRPGPYRDGVERGRFSEIDHTADLGLDLEGDSPAAVLEAAQRGLIRVLFGGDPGFEPDEERVVAIEAADRPELLKAWCERLWRFIEDDGFVAVEADVESTDSGGLRAVVRGTRPPADRLAPVSELKAVTYHQLAFEPAGEGWCARVIFDV